MSFLPPQFQIASDLHLETPLSTPQYASLHLPVHADNLLLHGDIGLVADAGLFGLLRRVLEQNRGCRVFYVLGNHETYRTTYEHACVVLREFEAQTSDEFGGRFHFLCRDRYDVDDRLTILGCTLWSAIHHDEEVDIAARSTDLNRERGIQNWSLQRHKGEFEKDVQWLNEQVRRIEKEEPGREVIIATHYCPTTDARARDPRHKRSPVSSNFATGLSREKCWESPMVKLWAFGHTHYSCEWRDGETGKLIVANQKGYAELGAGRARRPGMEVKMVEAGKDGWEVVERGRTSAGEKQALGVEGGRVTRLEVESNGDGIVNTKTLGSSLPRRMMRRVRDFVVCCASEDTTR